MTEPDDFGLSAIQTLAHVGAEGRSLRHTSFWKIWMTAVMAHSPRLMPRDAARADLSDPSATHEFVSLANVRIGCTLLRPAKGRVRAGLVALHGYSNVPTLAQAAEDWRPLVERGVAVLVLRVRGYPGSQLDCERLVRHAAAAEGGGGRWITYGLEVPLSDNGCGSEWVYAHAVADVVNGYRALRASLGQATGQPGGRVLIFMHGESVGAALAIVAASQLSDVDEVSRLAIGLPSMGNWPWRLSRPEPERGLGATGLVGAYIKDFPSLEKEVATSVRVLDAAIHARRVRRPVLCKLALRDDVVPAPAAAAVFNALGSDRAQKQRFITRYGHFDGGIADMRRHAQFDRLVMEYLDPDVDVMARDWESDMSKGKAVRCEKPIKDGEPTLFGAEPLPTRDGDEALIAAYVSTGRTLDDLPYTVEFDSLFRAAGSLKNEREVLHKLHNLRKAGRLPRLGKPTSSPPKIDETAEAALSGLVVKAVGSLGQRDQLPYTRQFDDLVAAFNQQTGRSMLPHDVWRLVAKIAK